VNKDLQNWQNKFAIAADKGSDELSEQTQEIVDAQLKTSVEGEGFRHVTQLEKTKEHELETLKKKIISIVESLPEDVTVGDEESAENDLMGAIRAAALSIRKHAQALRQWRNSFESTLMDKISDAADSHLDLLDGIQSLGLQEIGMRWAWMEGITYKDWAKYHALKKTFKEWRDEVSDVAFKHASLGPAREAADDVESNGMSVAEEAAKELARLKDVGRWKIRAKDSSDDFDTRVIPPSVAKAAKKFAENVESANKKVAENVATASEKAAENLENASASIIRTSQGTVESVISQATESASEAASAASAKVMGEEPSGVEEAASSVSSVASSVASAVDEGADAVSDDVSEMIHDGTSIVSETFTVVENSASTASSAASEAVMSSETLMAQSVLSDASEMIEEATSAVADQADFVSSSAGSAASQTSSKVWGGAMAQEVKGSGQPILDDVIDEGSAYSEQLQSVFSAAGDRYADATKAVSEAMLGVTKTQGTAESVTSVAGDLYSSAIAVASSALYGTTQGTGESIASVASSNFDAAVAA
jgi:hypothetical protein